MAYTSFSHTTELPRYRVVLPLSHEIDPTLPVVEIVAEQVGLQGILDNSKIGAASLFYLPRHAPGEHDKHQGEAIDGTPLDADLLAEQGRVLKAERDAAAEALRRDRQETARARREARIAAGIDPAWSLIDQVRAHLDLEETLIEHGYIPADNGRYLFPESTSGVAGVQILDGDDGVQRAFSHHGDDPLAPANLPAGMTSRAPDVLDVIAILDHGGDQRKALSSLASRFGIETPRPSAQDEFGALEPLPVNKKPRLLSINDIEALPDPKWLINGLLPEQSLAITYGPPKHGKTFIALSMALHVAAGRDWFGRTVQQGGVVYIAGEGAGGLKLRVRAARVHYGIPSGIPFWALPRAVNFSDMKAVHELAGLIREAAGNTTVGLVVIDTLARAMPGVDENSAGDVGRVIAACDWLKDQLGCTVMPVHHQGKDGDKGLRGSSALGGAVDTLLHATRQNSEAADIVTLAIEYQKEAEEGAPILFDLVVADATPGRTSLVPVLRVGAAPKPDNLTGQQKAALGILQELLPSGQVQPDGRRIVLESEWRKVCNEGVRVSTAEGRNSREKAFRRAFRELLDQRRVGAAEGWVWLPDGMEFPPVVGDTKRGTDRTLGGHVLFCPPANPGETGDRQDTPLKGCPMSPSRMPKLNPSVRQTPGVDFDLAGWSADDAAELARLLQ